MNFPTHIDQVIHDRQKALHAEARAHRLARTARAGRRTAASGCRRSELDKVLMELGDVSERLLSEPQSAWTERATARLLDGATAALESTARAAGLSPVGEDVPVVVSLRWLARLAERTAAATPDIDVVQVRALARIVADLQSLETNGSTSKVVGVRRAVGVRVRRSLPIRLVGAR